MAMNDHVVEKHSMRPPDHTCASATSGEKWSLVPLWSLGLSLLIIVIYSLRMITKLVQSSIIAATRLKTDSSPDKSFEAYVGDRMIQKSQDRILRS